MLDEVDLNEMMPREKCKKLSKKLKSELSDLQQPIKQNGLPVIILFEGWGAAGKGSLISKLILNFDPRGFKVYSIIEPTELEKRKPVLWRYWTKIPKRGQIAIFDRSWYMDVSSAKLEENVTNTENIRRMENIKTFERQLTDDGYLLIKFFIHINRKEQKERFEKLCKDKNTAWRVTKHDWERNRQYDKYYSAFDEMLEYTNTKNAPWYVISGTDKKLATVKIYETVLNNVKNALGSQKSNAAYITKCNINPGNYDFVKLPKLTDVPLDKSLNAGAYKKELKAKQHILSELHGEIYRKKVPVIIAYEGWDAAGKGGNIRRVAKALDPRGYEVVPIAAPTPDEKARQYLWRFWINLPRDGHVTIFDRTWYGRVMVERIEGFCSENDWRRAYREINEFERQLYDWGAVIVKFWLQIDKDEQLKRFQNRQNTPSKRWKITDEDWRNREKWDKYEICVNEMIKYTSTDFAPWHIIESQDKKYARVKTLEIIIDTISKKLN